MLLFAVLSAAAGAQPAAMPSENERAMAELLDQLDARWGSRQAEPLSDLFTTDAEFQVQGSRTLHGRTEIRRSYEQQFSKLPTALRHRTRIEAIRTLSSGTIFVAGQVVIADPGNPDGGTWRSALSAVAVRRDGAWRLEVLRIVPQ
jgi:uncharacterized protein (TIGR02246 family)